MADLVYVYELLTGEARVAHAPALRAQLARFFAVPPTNPIFYVSPVSGAFRLIDQSVTQHRGSSSLPATSEETAAVALEYMRNVNRDAAAYRQRARVDAATYPDPFPERLQHFGTELLVDDDGMPHRWISEWVLTLPWKASAQSSDRPDKARVTGASVMLTLGPGRGVSGVVSTVRQISSTRRVRALPPPGQHRGNQDHDHQDHDHEHGEEPDARGNPEVFYPIDGPEEPQEFLAPYYRAAFLGHSHGPAAHPASPYSVVLEIAVDLDSQPTTLVAMVMDQRGEMIEADERGGWLSAWMVLPLSGFDTSAGAVFQGSRVRIQEPGVFHVELCLTNRDNGASRLTYNQISVAPSAQQVVG